ncbi:hypothetical protein [Sinosporangium siamense]|uniref:Uncharacterized protein n=1 Tax=Sinosporangium siamense TaxID=1367973 RepID=A0A919V9N0_9ACTN|nr:hypothetical protein [Sinosporangium siamense]GII95491.1 hypothetical protein Ssi02_57220 [Sinosporangium siamense]
MNTMNIVRVRISQPLPYGEAEEIAVDEHMSVMCGEPRWLSVADVIVYRPAMPKQEVEQVFKTSLRRYPGSLVVALTTDDGSCVVGTREGGLLRVATLVPWVAASAAHAWTVAGQRLDDLHECCIRAEDQVGARAAGPGPVLLEVRRVR